ncbi:hypothetical protein LguiB_009699 [Lonicera macranthoides]
MEALLSRHAHRRSPLPEAHLHAKPSSRGTHALIKFIPGVSVFANAGVLSASLVFLLSSGRSSNQASSMRQILLEFDFQEQQL